MRSYKPTTTGSVTGRPKYYAEFDSDSFIIAPTPDSNYTFELHYFYRPASLTAAGDSGSTWLSTNAPIALLYACLTEAAIFLKMDPAEIATYDQRFESALARLKTLQKEQEHRVSIGTTKFVFLPPNVGRTTSTVKR